MYGFSIYTLLIEYFLTSAGNLIKVSPNTKIIRFSRFLFKLSKDLCSQYFEAAPKARMFMSSYI